MLIYFPQLHEELVTEKIHGALFMASGIETETVNVDSQFTPLGFPVKGDLCRKMVDDFMQYGEHFKRSGEMASYIGHVAARSNVESDTSIESELMQRLADVDNEVDYTPALIQSQLLIALSYAYEEKIIELGEIEKSLNSSWAVFGEKIGVSDEDVDLEGRFLGEVISNAPVTSGTAFLFPWKKTLEGFSAFLPDDATLVTSNADAISTWEDCGIPLVEIEIEGCVKVFKSPVWKLLGYEKKAVEKPWLNRELNIAVAGS